MADGTTLSPPSPGGDKIQTKDYGAAAGKLPSCEVWWGGNTGGSTNGNAVAPATPFPVQVYTVGSAAETAATGVTIVTGGVGIIGWLSSIYKVLHSFLLGVSGEQVVSTGGSSTVAVGAGGGAAAVVVKASPGRLCRVLVTATGSANLLFYDNASAGTGTVIGVVPSTAVLGQTFDIQAPAVNGIVAEQASGSPACTVQIV